jgi:UDP-N-acetylmuramyl pentapeptide phosphotransferase/UDP-N-acetylglucosamine-1-phosphate transferase
MTLAERLLIGLVIAATVVYLITPYAIVAANRMAFLDVPSDYKGHLRPTPYLGGAALMAGFVVAVLVAAGDWHRTAPLLGGVAVLWVVGTIDDRWTVRPALRVLVELALAWVVWTSGLGWHLHAGGLVDLGVTCVWIVAVVNAFNLFDNMDGAASTMALVVSAGAAILGLLRGDVWLAVGAASLGGACLGFLPRNICLPARIFLGDGGSMPLGFAAAVLVMVAATTSVPGWQSLLVALLLVGIPALDTSLVIVSRRRRHAPIVKGGLDHLTHRTRSYLPSARAVALALGGVQAVVSVVAVLASQGGASFVVVCAILYVVAGACAIAVIETGGMRTLTAPRPSPAIPLASREPRWQRALPLAIMAALGLGSGLSPFFFAYYDASIWVPIGLGLIAASAVGVVARPARPSGPAALALGGLLGLGVWSLASTAWAESIENAVVTGNRWLVYGALLLLLLVLRRGNLRSAVLLGAAGLGVTAVAVSVLARLLGSDPASLFLAGRLDSPLGYINGEGCLFAMGFWLAMAAVESRRARIAGPAAGLATLMACLALLSESRGTALAMVASLIVVMTLVPGRTRRAYGLLVVAGAVAAAAPDLLRIYDHYATGAVPVGVGHAGGRSALLAAVAAGALWALLTAGWSRVGVRTLAGVRTKTVASRLLLIPVLVALALAIGSAGRIEHDARSQWQAFTSLSAVGSGAGAPGGQSRLLSGGGYRYDYWRIAWRVWLDHPLIGVGGGNYSVPYYQQRATTEDIDQPHSVELQVLAELGVVGALLLAAFIGGVGWGVARIRRQAASSQLSRALMVGGLGAFAAWLAQTSVDWMHLLPGLTAIALAGVAVLVDSKARPSSTAARSVAGPRLGARVRRPAVVVAASTIIVTLIVAGASLSRQELASLYLSSAQSELDAHPAAAITDANHSLDVDSDSVEAYYVKAAALAHYDEAAAAEATLNEALAREPQNFVTWALLGDIAVREGRLADARRDYVRAHLLNPRDATLAELAANPRSALG